MEPEEVANEGQREVLLILAQTFTDDSAMILNEPSVVGSRCGRPDIVVIDPCSGVHTVEVKSVGIEQVRSIQPGGAMELEYRGRTSRKDPRKQASKAMFAIKDAATHHFGGDLNAGFEWWVAFPRIRRRDWQAKFGELLLSEREILFQDDLESSGLGDRMREQCRSRLGSNTRIPDQQIESLRAAMGDSAALAPMPRPRSSAPEGSLGEQLEEQYADYRVLTPSQQKLAEQFWNDGPRLVRGVAGSGKTVVLATQVARLLERIHREGPDLFEPERDSRRTLVVCFNRTLAPFITERVAAAYQQRVGEDLPSGMLDIRCLNGLMYHLSESGLVSYQHVKPGRDAGEVARRYLADLEAHAARTDAARYHAIFVDEGQDFHEDEYRLLLRLCGRTAENLPRMFVFYDDAQNLYGQVRPTWKDLGLEIRGRSVVMDEAIRNTRQILEPAFNVLIGSHAGDRQATGTRSFADLSTLRDKHLIEERDGHVAVKFAKRMGDRIRVQRPSGTSDELGAVVARITALFIDEGLAPHDVLVLTLTRNRAEEVARQLGSALPNVAVHCPFEKANKDVLAVQKERLTVSTVASAKGYDAAYVVLVSADAFGDQLQDRAAFYVGCTRARDWLEVFFSRQSPLMSEFQRALEATDRGAA